MDDNSEAPSNEQEVLKLAKECGLLEAAGRFSNDFLPRLAQVASKLRAKDAATIELDKEIQSALRMSIIEQDVTIVQLKDDLRLAIVGEKHLSAELTASQKQVKKFRDALEWIDRVNACDYEYQRKAREALAATAPAPTYKKE